MEKTSPQLTADGQISLRSISPTGHPLASEWARCELAHKSLGPPPACLRQWWCFFLKTGNNNGADEPGVAPSGVVRRTFLELQNLFWRREMAVCCHYCCCCLIISSNLLAPYFVLVGIIQEKLYK